MVLVEAALLLEVPVAFRLDQVIALRCSREEQLRRLEAKGGYTRQQLESRLDSQAHLEKSFYRADHVVDTEGPIDDVVGEFRRVIGLDE